MTPPPPPSLPPVTQLTLVTDAHGVPVLVRFPDGTDLAPATLIAHLAEAADCAAALGAARADAAGLRVSVERLSAKRKAEDAEEIAALRAEVERLRRVIEIGRRVLGCRRNNPEMHDRLTAFSTALRVYEQERRTETQVSAEWETGDAATISALRSVLQRFVVLGHCDEVRRGVAQCGGVCRWCEAARALSSVQAQSAKRGTMNEQVDKSDDIELRHRQLRALRRILAALHAEVAAFGFVPENLAAHIAATEARIAVLAKEDEG